MDHAKLEAVLRDAALEAGKVIMEIYDSPDFGVETKADDSPVTKADLAADEVIRAALTEAFPEIPAVTEEAAESHAAEPGPIFFLVDPLDGTKEFVKRRGEFTVNIALIENGVPTRGVVFAPARGRLFITDAEGAAWEETGGERTPLKVSAPDNAALRIVASKSHRDAALEEYIGRYQVADSVAAGSSLKFCLVAAGEADFYPRLGPTMEWDTAAGHAVLAAAGGRVTTIDGEDFLYGKPDFANPPFVAWGGAP